MRFVQNDSIRWLLTILIGCLLLSLGYTVHGQVEQAEISAKVESIVVDSGDEIYSLAPYLEILEDADGDWTYEDVTASDLASQFVPNEAGDPNFGFTESAYWIRFGVTNEADESVRWLLQLDSILSYVDAYIPTGEGSIVRTVQTGAERPYYPRDIEYPGYNFDLNLEPGEEKIVYLRVESEPALQLPLAVLSQDLLVHEITAGLTIYGLIFGMLLIMIGYHLILFLYLRDVSYLYFVLFLLGSLIGMLWVSDVGHRYIWPDSGRFNTIGGQFSFMLTMVGTLLFTRSFLVTKKYAPRFDKAIIGLALAFLVLMVIQFLNARFTARIGIVLLLLSYVLVFAVGFLVWWRGYRPARYFVLAWMLWLTNSLFYVLSLADM